MKESSTAPHGAKTQAAQPDRQPHRPLHLHGRFVLLVAAGGILGALSRYGFGMALPAPGAWPLPTLLINLSGALALGWLLEALARSGPDAGLRRIARLGIGSGFLGAYTTYSTLALDSVHLFGAGRGMDAMWYLAASLLGGVAATTLGIWLGALRHRSTQQGQKALK
ncbi:MULTISPECIES: CrcB family protein [Arthrobacter]|jgi:CrcB protein|uniref:Fluoride-specific ion channel FluC n=1 Tax=Arthrobacter bambusae TaxID=1338426 RepID=A0AAW8DE33_9MICC|nr:MULTISPECIES: CrcB family protein [Arthrobacter]MDP9903329.1 CrcB protein [Arthrobacter bambusae]MDQ0128677.1 CrcB protein [Arthrobacter bambusae]MDQ0180018.1 CrcB protein [Arthrobacter bambusae]MDQ0238179.1 CrcB protein [Arthrobacter bambusae]GAP57560.1 putative fluoride ion transporter CrcB 2 [Arthrobacter sp. Hiyo1]